MLSIEDYLDTMRANGVGKSGIYNTKISLEQFNRFKPLTEADYMDIVRYVNWLRDEKGYKQSTINLRKSCIKKYYKDHDRDDIVKKLQIKREVRQLDPKTILNPEDINYLLEHMDSDLYKAIVIFLYESGARINEALAVRIEEDIVETNIGYDLTLFGDKTRQHNYAYREMILTESAAYIREYLMVRNSDSPYLFPLKDKSVHEWLTNLRETLNFKKPLNPHAFRHGCATRLVRKGMQESLIRKQLGWSPNSNMLSVYIHLADTDLKTYQLMQSGEITEETPLVEIIKPAETAMDRISQQELDMIEMREMLQTVMKDNLTMKAQLEAQTMIHPEEFVPDSIPTSPLDKNLNNIKEAVQDFNVEKAIKEAPIEKALKLRP